MSEPRLFLRAVLLAVFATASCFAQQPGFESSHSPSLQDATRRIDQLEQVVAELQRELGEREVQRGDAIFASAELATGGAPPHGKHPSSHFVTYDNGWTLRPYDRYATPFELKFNLHNQFRYTGFARSVDTATDAAGNVKVIKNRNDFDINRGRLVFSGYAFDPDLTFYTNIDYNTVAQEPVLLLLSWMSARFSDSLSVSAGLGKVPGTWEWEESSRFTLGAERTMATTFFRPSITAGVWAHGEPREGLHYRFLIGDGFNTFTLRAGQLDTNLVYSGLVWWEPWGDFGVGFSDVEYHDTLAVRFGGGLTFAANDAEPTGEPGPEQTVIRLSDGTRLVTPGALAPGVTVNEFDITLCTVHWGLKHRGASFATEYFFRWLSSLEGDGALPVDSLFDQGFFVQGGLFVRENLELFAHGSQVSGDFGTGSEIAGGLNYYLNGERGARMTLDVARVDSSPAEQNRTGFVAGASGTLVRAQYWMFF